MSLPATAADIYDLLTGDETISEALGSYTLADGTTMAAAAVLAANESLPPGTTAEGIELVVTAVPGFAPKVLLTAETLPNPTWRIYVMGWGSAAQIQAVAQRIMALLPGATAAAVPGDAPGSGIGVIDQTVVTWSNPTLVVTP